jgi:riboflavin-specific deaminase-like protein
MECSAGQWTALLQGRAPDGAAGALYRPLLAPAWVLGRIAQSLDGRIATSNGASRWISGQQDLLHTHRLRALCDAIIVGAGTVAADDPQLTTRLVEGPSPVRVVLDPNRRLRPDHRVFQSGPPTLVAHAEGADGPTVAERMPVPRAGGSLDLRALVAALAARGLRRLFIEGGGVTVSRFLAAGLLDRLHVTVAPLLLGSGIPSFALPEIASPDQGLRLTWQAHPLGQDMLFDMKLRADGT